MPEVVDVSVIVPSYNRPAALRTTIDCLLVQRPSAREILVVDQSDVRDAAVDAHLDALAAAGKVRLFRPAEAHPQKARNLAIREARGEVLLFLDDDVVMESGLVGAHWANYSDPEMAAVAGFYLEPGETASDQLPPQYAHPRMGWLHVPHNFTRRIDSHHFPSCNGSVRRAVAVQLGGFDENYEWTLLDDTDFACRLRRLGVRAVHDPAAALTHLKEPSAGKRPTRRAAYVIADRRLWYTWFYFYLMNFGVFGVPTLLVHFRRCVLRRPNLLRPWYAVAAFVECVVGAAGAVAAMSRGRRLGALA